MGFYEKDGKRIDESRAFEYALDKLMTGDVCEQDDFVEWFFRPLMGWHFYEENDEMESIEDMTQEHINQETGYLRRA